MEYYCIIVVVNVGGLSISEVGPGLFPLQSLQPLRQLLTWSFGLCHITLISTVDILIKVQLTYLVVLYFSFAIVHKKL